MCERAVAARTENKAYPFCSERCRLVDLGRWFSESYVVSSPATVDDDAETWSETKPKEPAE